jgi:hypothetical protein
MSEIRAHLVVRSAGERTAETCVRLASESLPSSAVTVIREVPFERALRETFRVGIEKAATWTVAIDADVLVRPGAIAALLDEAEAMPAAYAQLGGHVFDKITGLHRQAGNRVYRTRLLPNALECIPPTGTETTPEFFVAREMARRGHPAAKSNLIVGLHDFEQSFADLYRKAMLHSVKHRRLIAELVTRSAERGESDPDFRVVLKALWDGLSAQHLPTVDARNHSEAAELAIRSLGLVEKAPLDWASLRGTSMEAFSSLAMRLPSEPVPPRPGFRQRLGSGIQDRFRRHGPVKGALACLGAALRGVGTWLER